MIFYVAIESSISFIKETVQRFDELLGVFANLGKSSIFLVRVMLEFFVLKLVVCKSYSVQ